MANHPSAEKRHRQSERRRLRNKHVKSTVRTTVKRVRDAVTGGDQATATTALLDARSKIDKAVSKGVLHRKTGSRYVARLSKAVGGISKRAAAAPAAAKKAPAKKPAKKAAKKA